MKRIKAKLSGKGLPDDPYIVNLPNWVMDAERDVNGEIVYVDKEKGWKKDSCDYTKKECYVLVPDDETKEVQGKTKLDQSKIRKKYKKNWSKFIASKVEL